MLSQGLHVKIGGYYFLLGVNKGEEEEVVEIVMKMEVVAAADFSVVGKGKHHWIFFYFCEGQRKGKNRISKEKEWKRKKNGR